MAKVTEAHLRIGAFFKKQRELQHLSQGDLSSALGYTSSQFVSNWERGLCSPPMAIIPQLASILKLSKKEVIDVLTSEYRKELEDSFRSSKEKSS